MESGEIANIAIIIATQAGLFLWLRNDIQQLRKDMDERLRTVEKEQARMAGLLEGMGFTNRTPSPEA
ncbi:MAG: hypothetical protein OXG39_11820 [Chloroflexi bacterium]|nr:hypothetical protein [Chloroflexota bacterium]